MSRTKTKPSPPPANDAPPAGVAPPPSDVLTLTEAAAYLRVSPEDVVRLAATQQLPGRQVGTDWRFLKTAIQQWLGTPSARPSLLGQVGAIKDDPYFDEMLKEIYRRRGRPETEEG